MIVLLFDCIFVCEYLFVCLIAYLFVYICLIAYLIDCCIFDELHRCCALF